MGEIATERLKELRRGCLMVLREMQVGTSEGWSTPRMVFNCLRSLDDDLTLAEVHRSLGYLKGKDYVQWRDLKLSKWDPPNPSFRLLPKGIDLLDKTIPPDPGVEDDRA